MDETMTNVDNNDDDDNNNLHLSMWSVLDISLGNETTNDQDSDEDNLESSADKVFELWIKEEMNYNDFIKNDGEKRPTKLNSNLEKCLMHFDVETYFKKVGCVKFPSIALGMRILMAKMDNSGYTERMFSTGSNAMSSKQTKMNFDLLEKRVLLSHNKKFMENHM